MIARNLHRLKVEKAPIQTTSYAGLPLLTELAHQTGIVRQLDTLPDLWQRRGRYASSDYILGLGMTLVAGGEGLDDTRILSADAGLKVLALPDVPAANSFGRFLGRFTQRALYRLGEVTAGLAIRHLEADRTYTLDLDSSLIESDKELAEKTYKGFDGYNPVLAWLDEADVFLGGVFREGNASPQCHLVSLLKYCRTQLPEGVKVRLRSDSAGYRMDLIEYCRRHGIQFTITADLDHAVMETIEGIPKKRWRLVVRGNETFLLAETIHVPGGGNNAYGLPAFRLIVTQKLSGQLELFEPVIKYQAILTDFDESWTAEKILEHHNGRGRMEKAIGELKGGFGLHGLPCGKLLANAAYFQVCLLAYNLVQTFKRFALPEGWGKFCIKNLRFRLLNQAAIVVRHARRLVLKLSAAFPHFETFEKARWAVLSPSLAT